MSLDFPANVTCDKCGVNKTTPKLAITKLKPHVEMHLVLPAGWVVSTLADSGELFVTCPSCPPMMMTLPPSAVVEDPASDPTMRPPPLPARVTRPKT